MCILHHRQLACTATVPMMVLTMVTAIWSTFFTVVHLILHFIRNTFLKGLTKRGAVPSRQASWRSFGCCRNYQLSIIHCPLSIIYCLCRHGRVPDPSPPPREYSPLQLICNGKITTSGKGVFRFFPKLSQTFPNFPILSHP